ncbi:MAG: hypothetical protein M5U16_16540 [Hyphomicrobium sp.]|nr:hypothetical protein [Hyphomicrobium sp.]
MLLLCLGLTAYFVHHAINGRHGFEARSRLIERSALLEFEIKSLEAVRAKLERDVALLAAENPTRTLSRKSPAKCLASCAPTMLW